MNRLLSALVIPAVSAGMLLAATGTAFADDPVPPVAPPPPALPTLPFAPVPGPPVAPITLTPEQSARVCNQWVPGLLAGIDRWRGAVNGGPDTPGSTPWLQARADEARRTGHPWLAFRLDQWAGRPDRGARLDTARQRIDAFRAQNCHS